MQTPTPPTVALASDYTESHAAATGCPEQRLWAAVLAQAGEDLRDRSPGVRRDAAEFFESPALLLIMDLAGLDSDLAPCSDLAPWLRSRAKQLAEASPEQRQPTGKRISYRGQTHNLTEWSEVTGISIFTLGHRLRHGWSIKRALTTRGRH